MITCTFENGRQGYLRHVTTSVIALNEGREVLLARRASHLSRPNTYTLPGGYLDRDEDAMQGALRELLEETGYTGKIIHLFQITHHPHRPKEDKQNVEFIFVAYITGGEKN